MEFVAPSEIRNVGRFGLCHSPIDQWLDAVGNWIVGVEHTEVKEERPGCESSCGRRKKEARKMYSYLNILRHLG